MRSRPVRSLVAACVGVLAVLSAGAAAAATTPVPATPKFAVPAETTVPYDPQTTCAITAGAGTVKLRSLVLATYPKTRDYGILRACTSGGASEHKDGRAWDWGVSVTNVTEARQATALIHWMLTDQALLARRLGVMYIVWNDRIISTYRFSEGWRPYVSSACRTIPLTSCSPTLRHRDHVHFSLSRAGGAGSTTFWTGRAAGAPAPISLNPAALRLSVAAID